jgi:hypothetical protein
MIRFEWPYGLRPIALQALWFKAWVLIAAYLFRTQRADYYEYLADVMDSTAGAKTLQNIFYDDVSRYAATSPRGVLSRVWLERFPQGGGDLFSTWSGTLPLEDLLAVQSAQYSGSQALTKTLRQLAGVVNLIDGAQSALVTTAFAGLAGLFIALGSVLSIPFFSAKQLQQVFSAVPPENFSGWTKALFATADLLSTIWPFVSVGLILCALFVLWSFASWTGSLRSVADKFGPWAFYRRVQTVRFVSLLAVTLTPGGSQGARLRDAIALQMQGTTPWFAGHLHAMVTRLDLGANATDALETGLIDLEIWWYFTDLIQTLGLDEALHRARLRTERYALKRIQTQAVYLRWGALLLSLMIVLGIAFWHAQVFEELRQGLSLHYSR